MLYPQSHQSSHNQLVVPLRMARLQLALGLVQGVPGCPVHPLGHEFWSSSRPVNDLVLAGGGYFFLSGGLLMGSYYCRVDHHPIQIRFLQRVKDLFPHSALRPASEPPIIAVPFTEAFRQVPPRRTRASNPKYRVDKQAIIG